MSQYVFSPAGSTARRNALFKNGIEYIGSKQKGSGSNFSKGKRYLKSVLHCSSRSISLSCSVKDKIYNHNYLQYGPEVYYYHKEWCAKILKIVISYLIDNQNDPFLPQVFANSDYLMIFNKIYSARNSQLHWVATTNYKNQGTDAQSIYNEINKMS